MARAFHGKGIKARTEHGEYKAIVKEHEYGHPFLVLEPTGETIPMLGDGLLSLRLREGTTIEEAEILARTLNRHLKGASITLSSDD
ncbi:hypothetical protein DC522_01635 [Microvirga sp. KLBC 81]|uniref:hypothetical protein n=1 Tax=Microvirga sp. KLBC 81 TaxID=1862707 RepID=UPI000D510FB6|nr:hypothetical protein [Microvirga sp. KLBC 81]PVE25966.1 hypothetical protein DC522_01635 [Microvirga sp. KLBC 81]